MRTPLGLKNYKKKFENIVDNLLPSYVTPNMITMLGLALNCCLILAWIYEYIGIEVFLWLYLSTQMLDILDGALARSREVASVFGQRLDTGVDMISGVLLLGVLYYKTSGVELVWICAAILIYLIRFWLVMRQNDLDVGGYKNALTVGVIVFYYLNWNLNSVVIIILLFNLGVVYLGLKRYSN